MRIDDDFMKRVGLDQMPEVEKQAFVEHATEEFEVRLGQKIAERMSEVEMQEFEQLSGSVEVADWLDQHVPDYREIAEEVYRDFQNEIMSERDSILA